jgi:hypothetical protein
VDDTHHHDHHPAGCAIAVRDKRSTLYRGTEYSLLSKLGFVDGDGG